MNKQSKQLLKEALNKVSHVKEAKPRSLGDIPSQTNRADYIGEALDLFSKAQALAQPTKEDLEKRNLTPEEFNEMLGLIRSSGDTGKLRASEHAPKPISNLPWYTGAAGALAGGGLGQNLGSAGIGALLGLGGGWLFNSKRENRREDMLDTVKLLKEYGILNNETLQRTYPILRK